ncbi:hypothetical protein [Psychromonas aquimarina]|uniref:hypothetical protein n=1 Tax=Psychromonas aquimarina TaxID=444919 RepID=UPI0004922000|nr:hypothetical protein [Psychromonas aquimarina]
MKKHLIILSIFFYTSIVSAFNIPLSAPKGAYTNYFTYYNPDDEPIVSPNAINNLKKSKSLFAIESAYNQDLILNGTGFFIRTFRNDNKICMITAGHNVLSGPTSPVPSKFAFTGYFNYIGKPNGSYERVKHLKMEEGIIADVITAHNDRTGYIKKDIALLLVNTSHLPPLEQLFQSGFIFLKDEPKNGHMLHHPAGWSQRLTNLDGNATLMGDFYRIYTDGVAQNQAFSKGTSGSPIFEEAPEDPDYGFNVMGPAMGVLSTNSSPDTMPLRDVPPRELVDEDAGRRIPRMVHPAYTTLSSIKDEIEEHCLAELSPALESKPYTKSAILVNKTGELHSEDPFVKNRNFFLLNNTTATLIVHIYDESNQSYREKIKPYEKIKFEYNSEKRGYVYRFPFSPEVVSRVQALVFNGGQYAGREQLTDNDFDVIHFTKGNPWHRVYISYKPKQGANHVMDKFLVNDAFGDPQFNNTADFLKSDDDTGDGHNVKILSYGVGRARVVEILPIDEVKYFDPRDVKNIVFRNKTYDELGSEGGRIRITGWDLYPTVPPGYIRNIIYNQPRKYPDDFIGRFNTLDYYGNSLRRLDQIDLCDTGFYENTRGNKFVFSNAYSEVNYRTHNAESLIEIINLYRGKYRSFLEAKGICRNTDQQFINVSLSEDGKTFSIDLEGYANPNGKRPGNQSISIIYLITVL